MIYASADDPYTNPATGLLHNLPNITSKEELEHFERLMSGQRNEEPFLHRTFTPAHLRATHHHLFQDIYPWAGEYRTVGISKGGNEFCQPAFIAKETDKLFAILPAKMAEATNDTDKTVTLLTHLLAELNAIHPFREGNGRAARMFAGHVAEACGFHLHWSRLAEAPQPFLQAMITSFDGDETVLLEKIQILMAKI